MTTHKHSSEKTNGEIEPLQVSLQSISKKFGSHCVLNHVDFEIQGGEIHALMGENGAGKSTLMKILSGVHLADSGTIEINGLPVSIQSMQDAQNLGIAIIHQELNLIDSLSVAENLFLGREPQKWGLLDQQTMRETCRSQLNALGAYAIHVDALASDLSIGQQQMVEIAKALSLNARVLILDEPTAALTDREILKLFSLMRQLKQRGVAMIYVSHRMDEIFTICDQISVLRDGVLVGQREIKQTCMNEIVRLMVGRELNERFPSKRSSLGEVRLSVQNLSDENHIKEIQFDVRAGEILGIAGLMGAGRSEILKTIFGINKRQTGQIWLDGNLLDIKTPSQAIEAGFGFVTEDRKTEGLVLNLSVRENSSLVHLREYFHALWKRLGVISYCSENKATIDLVKRLSIRTHSTELAVNALSGGNQQKVVFAKWLAVAPKVLLLDEPTRGVDVGGKAEIYQIIQSLAEQGVAIVMVSSELPEIMGISHRVLVLHEGRQTAVFENNAELTQERIMTAATGTHVATKIDTKATH